MHPSRIARSSARPRPRRAEPRRLWRDHVAQPRARRRRPPRPRSQLHRVQPQSDPPPRSDREQASRAARSSQPTFRSRPRRRRRPPSPIAGCGTGETGFAAHRSEIPKTLAFGHATIEFTSAGVSMRDGSYDADDVIPGGVGLTADEIAVVVAPGDHIILRATAGTLVATTATASPWSDVSFAGGLAASAGRPRPWPSASAPTDRCRSRPRRRSATGRSTFYPGWHGDCLRGDGTAYARIKVR